MIPGLRIPDATAISLFLGCWATYHILIEGGMLGPGSLNTRMNAYRMRWMEEMLTRENRMVDVQVMAALHQGSAFFASTSLIAIGGTLSLVRAGTDVNAALSVLPFGISDNPAMWEIKLIGLAVIFAYAFFKFAWAYRLFNYASILLGATPPASKVDDAARVHARRTGRMTLVAGRHFNRGQRAFFFALAYLGWFLGPWVFMMSTIAALIVMARRQLGSDALSSILDVTEERDSSKKPA